jgi:hypothetical protein
VFQSPTTAQTQTLAATALEKMDKSLNIRQWTAIMILISGCGTTSMEPKKETIEILVIGQLDKLKNRINGQLTVTNIGDKTEYGYNENMKDSIFDYSVTSNIKSDSILIYNYGNVICPLDTVRNYTLGSRQITIKRYLYDVPGPVDEEADFYFIQDYGLIAMKFYYGNELFFNKGDSLSRSIIDRLRSDSVFLIELKKN